MELVDNLLAARLQMAISLGFHIVFAAIGVAMPFFMAVSHLFWLKTKKAPYLQLTKAWSKGVAIFFATGAVSGTVLSFELGLLWPEFMRHAGPIIGLPFSWEGTAFFLEAIALGLYLYGWNRLSPWTHWITGVVVGLSGVASAFFVICANGWMQSPAGFDWVDGKAVNIDPVAAMFNDAAFMQGLHMVVASFQATAAAVAGIHALLLLKNRSSLLHLAALKISLVILAVSSIIQPVIGDRLAKEVIIRQPVKFAAMEGLFESEAPASLLIGGIPDTEKHTVSFGLRIPGLLSFLAHGNFTQEVKGLLEFPREEWPPVMITHFAFQIMVAIGTLLALLGAVALVMLYKLPQAILNRTFLRFLVLCTPLGFIAIESGWIVTEVGRQPWIIQGIMKTKDVVTPVPGIQYSLLMVCIIYAFLSFIVTWLMIRQISALPAEAGEDRD